MTDQRDHKFMEELIEETRPVAAEPEPVKYASGLGIAYFNEPGIRGDIEAGLKTGSDALAEHRVRAKLAALRDSPAVLVTDFIRGIKGSV